MAQVKHRDCGTIFLVDESKNIHDMKRACPNFFKTKFGKRETYSVYRGCLIVRNTKQYTGQKPVRETVVYLFCDLEKYPDLFCVSVDSHCNDIRQAKRLIDALLGSGVYYYGFYK